MKMLDLQGIGATRADRKDIITYRRMVYFFRKMV